ncbi:MAG: fused MFS/spermidine synthase [Sandaracinus sp.]
MLRLYILLLRRLFDVDKLSDVGIAKLGPYLAFFLSGASSLIFQTIWTRMLHHVFGATSVAISTVLTVFMAGLGLGNWISGRVAHRIKHPIFTYAFAELGVAIWGLLIPFMVASDGWLASVNSWLRVSYGADSSMFMIARFLCVVPILIVPTTLMGSTLPLLTRHFVSRSSDAETASRNVGVLYALNTYGAATGPLLSAFVLLPNVGLTITNIVACSMNLTLALMIFALRKQLIGSAWGSSEKLEILPSKETAETPAAADAPASSASPAADASSPAETPSTEKTTKSIKKVKKKKAGALEAARTADAGEPASDAKPEPKREKDAAPADDVWVPPVARRMAFVSFAASGMAALCYEVVWSRSLAMCIGSSIYSFALILETFLIGIATGAAAMSAFLGKDTRRPLVGVALTSFALTLIANTPWAVDFHIDETVHHGTLATWAGVSLFPLVLLVGTYMYAQRLQQAADVLEPGSAADITAPGLVMVLVPLAAAGINLAYFHTGYLPKVIASVVAAVAIFMAILLLLRRSPVLLLAVIQLYIAVATIVSYIWQDEVPYAFAQLVTGIGDLPSHVGTVQFFMFVTAMLCTLPATLGMGAMFPLTVRVWTSGGGAIARDAANVYTGNTFGSIVGSWLPGFVLMPAIGMERTLHAGIVLNMLLALFMLIAGAAEPDKDGKPSSATLSSGRARAFVGGAVAVAALVGGLVYGLYTGDSSARLNAVLGTFAFGAFVVGITALLVHDAQTTPPSKPPPGAGELPTWHAITVYVLSPLIPALLALLWLGTSRPDSILRWNQTQMTLGVFRVSLAEGMLDQTSWGQPDLVYYHDGLSTTVTVERWGRHYALKNNGKVDASNGDDMPTQITVSAYPMLMHSQGPTDLDVAVVGFGSGVTVGTTLSFPVRSVDVIELERSIPEAARFFEDVNLLEYQLDHFPFVEMDRLTVINDDGRNYLASTDHQYDIIISEPSNPWITGVSDLFTIDHFRIAKRRLRPGGIYCQWVQLYEMSPENIKTIFRTFAEVYRYVVVFAADDRSSDTVVLGSDAPLTFDLERMQRTWQLEAVPGRMSVPDQLERAYLHTPYDVFARVLLASRDEVMTYTQIEERRHGDVWEPDYASTNTRTCEPADCRRRPAEINTDDNARIEFGAPRDLIGFERYEGYLTTVYSAEWPFGRVEDLIENFGEGDTRARNLAELSMSLIGHGRYELAADFIEESGRAGRARETAVALEVLTHLLTNEHEPPIHVEAPVCGPEMDHDTCEQLQIGFDEVRAAIDRGQWGAALAAMEEIPSPLRLHSGPSLRFLYGYLLFKAAEGSFSQYRASAEVLEDLTRTEEDYVTRNPEVHYFLARAYDNEGEYGDALQQMRRYVESRLTISHSDMVDTPEPPDGEAHTTDAPGESDKTTHDD